MRRLALSVLAVCALLPSSGHADGPAADAVGQIEHLIDAVEHSPCTFIRNGDEYEGAAAAHHIQRKYEYYQDRIRSAEDFIDLAATKSALSGQPYQLRCPGQPAAPAADWLRAELQNFRTKTGGN